MPETEPNFFSPEKPETSSVAIEVRVYDTRWWEEFRQVGLFEAFEFLEGDKDYRNQQKEAFLRGEIENPTLDYPELNPEELRQREERLLYLKQRILEEEPNPVVKQAYRWKINEKIATLRMLRATLEGDMRRFRRWSEFIYGKPSPEIFAYTVNEIRQEVAKVLQDPEATPEQKEAGERLLQLLPQVEDISIPLPDEETFRYAQRASANLLRRLVPSLPELEKFDAQLIQEAFSEALQRLQAEGWKVIIDEKSSKTGIAVSQETQEVRVPSSRKTAKEKLVGLILHEIGTHVQRRIKGERSRLQLLGAGLDRYEKVEEGIATMREQTTKEKMTKYSGLEGHLAISLALGLDGRPRNFREVFEVLYAFFYFRNLKRGKSPEEAQKKAQTSAWNRCVRTFRGTDCRTRGVCFTKDIIYREGNIAIWQFIREHPEELVRFDVGKYDPTNWRHIWILTLLGIRDEDLEEDSEVSQPAEE
ncbi:DUF1704 domain-containing protein [bacterium]|nr:DUF1704 domain-containing protein [bacterium]